MKITQLQNRIMKAAKAHLAKKQAKNICIKYIVWNYRLPCALEAELEVSFHLPHKGFFSRDLSVERKINFNIQIDREAPDNLVFQIAIFQATSLLDEHIESVKMS